MRVRLLRLVPLTIGVVCLLAIPLPGNGSDVPRPAAGDTTRGAQGFVGALRPQLEAQLDAEFAASEAWLADH